MVTKNILVLAFAGLAGAALICGSARAQLTAGSAFPSVAQPGLDATAFPDTAGKVVIVDFWASWCAPCKASFPAYSRLQKAYGQQGLVVIAVSVDDSPSAYAGFVARHKPTFATAHDSQHRLVAAVQVPTMPTSYLLDRTGKVRFVHAGFRGEETEMLLRKEIETLLAEKPPTP